MPRNNRSPQDLHAAALVTRASQQKHGRGATLNMAGRFESIEREWFDDGWQATKATDDQSSPTSAAIHAPRLKTIIHIEQVRSIISRNDSPDIRFEHSINPYRGCEHGCIYCFARPTHAYLNLSPGLDFETQIFSKRNAAERLRKELRKRGHQPSPINIGANTDPYQPIEKTERITRDVLEVLSSCQHPITIITKNALICRDIDLLAPMAAQGLLMVFISISQLDNPLTRILEPRASTPTNRLHAIRQLRAAGIPVMVLVAPIIPFINDEYLERVLNAAAEAGATGAGYTLIRLPYELKDLFKDWLATHFPDRAEHVMRRIRDIRNGRENNAEFGHRMHGSGIYADLIRQRFHKTRARLGLCKPNLQNLNTSLFRAPADNEITTEQYLLFSN